MKPDIKFDVAVLCAGQSERFNRYRTVRGSKVLAEVSGHPLVHYNLRSVKRLGERFGFVDRVYVPIPAGGGPYANQIADYVAGHHPEAILMEGGTSTKETEDKVRARSYLDTFIDVNKLLGRRGYETFETVPLDWSQEPSSMDDKTRVMMRILYDNQHPTLTIPGDTAVPEQAIYATMRSYIERPIPSMSPRRLKETLRCVRDKMQYGYNHTGMEGLFKALKDEMKQPPETPADLVTIFQKTAKMKRSRDAEEVIDDFRFIIANLRPAGSWGRKTVVHIMKTNDHSPDWEVPWIDEREGRSIGYNGFKFGFEGGLSKYPGQRRKSVMSIHDPTPYDYRILNPFTSQQTVDYSDPINAQRTGRRNTMRLRDAEMRKRHNIVFGDSVKFVNEERFVLQSDLESISVNTEYDLSEINGMDTEAFINDRSEYANINEFEKKLREFESGLLLPPD